MQSEDIMDILKEYDIDVINIKNITYKGKKGVWFISTPDNYLILKKHSNSYKTIKFMVAAVEYLQNRGVYIPQIKPTRNGEKCVIFNDTCYVLSEAIIGKRPDFKNTEGIKRIIQELANFHAASIGFRSPDNCKPKMHLGLWKKKYGKQMNKLKHYYNIEKSNNNHTEFGKLILNEFPYFYNRMKISMSEHDKSHYMKWINEVKNIGCLCHQDFTAKNLIQTDSEDIYVIDTDGICIDIPTRDIRKILYKTIKNQGKLNIEIVRNIFKWYQMKNPLEFWQWKVLKPTLIYPHLFAGIMSKYYEKRDKTWAEEDYLARLEKMMEIQKSIEIIIENFDNVIPS
jgi:CotS family spore coat protein